MVTLLIRVRRPTWAAGAATRRCWPRPPVHWLFPRRQR